MCVFYDLVNESAELLAGRSLAEFSGANGQKTSAQENQGRWLGNRRRHSPTGDLVIRNLVVPTGACGIEELKPDRAAKIGGHWRVTKRVAYPITFGRSRNTGGRRSKSCHAIA